MYHNMYRDIPTASERAMKAKHISLLKPQGHLWYAQCAQLLLASMGDPSGIKNCMWILMHSIMAFFGDHAKAYIT